jgi:transposase-like protein
MPPATRLGHARRDQHGLLGALIRAIFAAELGAEARARLAQAVAQLERPLPKVARMLEEAAGELLAFHSFPREHWPKLRSRNPLERVNRRSGGARTSSASTQTTRR